MTIEPDRIEVTVRLLQNGRYTWTITLNTEAPSAIGTETAIANKLKQMDGALADKFPNHVKENSVKFSELDE